MGQASLISAAERARADAAITRLRAQGRIGGRFQRVSRQPAAEDATFAVEVHIHDGPLGNGRTVVVGKTVGTILVRKMVGDTPYGRTEDWTEIDLSRLP